MNLAPGGGGFVPKGIEGKVIAFIGRGYLQHVVLVYNGPARMFTLAEP
jgi:hypothetical protein